MRRLKAVSEAASDASFAPACPNKNIAVGWISVKINVVLIKTLQEVRFFLKQIHARFPGATRRRRAPPCPPCPRRAVGRQLSSTPASETLVLAPALVPRAFALCDGSPARAASEPPGTAPGTGTDAAGALGMLKPPQAAVWREPPSAASSADATPLYCRRE